MKFKKLLVLSSAFIFTFGAAACSTTSSSSQQPSSEASSSASSTVDEETKVLNAITNAADYVWQLYRAKDSTSISGNFDVVSIVAIGDYNVSVSWAVEQTSGTKGILKIVDKDANSKTVVTGYYDGLVKEQIVAKLVPTFSLNGTTKKFNEVTRHEGFNVKVDVLVLGTYEDWKNLASDKKTPINIKGVVTAVNTSDGSIVFENEEHGYFGYKATNGAKAKVGDTIIYTGTRSDYSGQEEFASGGSYAVVSSGNNVTPTDATADFKAAAKNETTDKTLSSKYQNRLVTLNNCKPTKVDSSKGYYYFTVDGGKTEYYVYSDTRYLKDYSSFIEKYSLALAANRTFNYTGVTTVYSNTYTFYGITSNPDVITVNGDAITDDTYVSVIKNNITTDFGSSKTYYEDTTIDFSSYVVGSSTVTATVTSGTTATIKDNKLTLTLSKEAEVTNTVEVKIKKGDAEETVTLTLTTVKSIESFTSDSLTYANFEGLSTDSKNPGDLTSSIECKKGEAKVNATVNFVSSYAATKYKEWTIAKGGSMTISAPAGYKIYRIKSEVYKSLSATVTDGTNELTSVKIGTGSNNDGLVYLWNVNGSTIKFEVATDAYAQSFYNLTIYLIAE